METRTQVEATIECFRVLAMSWYRRYSKMKNKFLQAKGTKGIKWQAQPQQLAMHLALVRLLTCQRNRTASNSKSKSKLIAYSRNTVQPLTPHSRDTRKRECIWVRTGPITNQSSLKLNRPPSLNTITIKRRKWIDRWRRAWKWYSFRPIEAKFAPKSTQPLLMGSVLTCHSVTRPTRRKGRRRTHLRRSPTVTSRRIVAWFKVRFMAVAAVSVRATSCPRKLHELSTTSQHHEAPLTQTLSAVETPRWQNRINVTSATSSNLIKQVNFVAKSEAQDRRSLSRLKRWDPSVRRLKLRLNRMKMTMRYSW